MTKENNTSDIAKEELMKYGTHATGSPEQFKTRTTSEVKQVNPPEQPNSGSMGAY